jgi:hypothetical protein
MNIKKELVDLAATLVGETEKAYKFDIGKEEHVWLPKSQCEWDKDAKEVTLPMWLATDKGLV